MALAKSDNQYSGRFGGVYFKHDSAGQHINAMPRKVRLLQEGNQKKAKAYYGSHKHHEYWDPGPPIPDEPPKDERTVKVYSLRYITTYRDPSILKPTGKPPPNDPEKIQEAGIWMYDYWYEFLRPLKVPQVDVALVCYRYYVIGLYTLGLIAPQAKAWAIEQATLFFNKCILVNKIVNISIYAALALVVVTWNILEFLESQWGYLDFNKWDLILRSRDKLYWAGLQGHPTKKFYAITQGPELILPGFLGWHEADRDYGRAIFFQPSKAWQWLTSSAVLWYVWTVHNIHTIWLGEAHVVEEMGHWMLLDPEMEWFVNMPKGYSRPADEVLAYLNNLHNLFFKGEP